ncbi:MAG: hypothetical protein U9Q75_01605 [Pseudomonadota bacterium]|nr:hypothetical protein [Pseudomonadota bacterium]
MLHQKRKTPCFTYSFFLLLTMPFSSVHAEGTITLEKPPASLKQWYKPENKRNVWHHNMFKLHDSHCSVYRSILHARGY